jgi:hypothetical protein
MATPPRIGVQWGHATGLRRRWDDPPDQDTRPDAKYGKHTVFLGSSFPAMQGQQHTSDRAALPRRQRMLLQGENDRQRLGIPLLGDVR